MQTDQTLTDIILSITHGIFCWLSFSSWYVLTYLNSGFLKADVICQIYFEKGSLKVNLEIAEEVSLLHISKLCVICFFGTPMIEIPLR